MTYIFPMVEFAQSCDVSPIAAGKVAMSSNVQHLKLLIDSH